MSQSSKFNMNQYLDSRNIIQKPGKPIELSQESSSHQRPLFIESKNKMSLHPDVQSHISDAESCTATASFTATHSLCSG
jgi:hypothetical protein